MSSASGRCAGALFAITILVAAAGLTGPAHRLARLPDLRASTARTDRDLVASLPPAARSVTRGQTAAGRTRLAGSLNWAGYAISRRAVTFRSVSATFFVPYLNCAQSPGATMSSAWAGLDGFISGSNSVEQTGIAANCTAGGSASYFGWVEMFPRAEAKIPLRIRPGDSVTATVSYRGARFRLTLTDNTTGQHYTRDRGCPDATVSGHRLRCLRSSAEVIAEAPETGTGGQLTIAPLADYGAISFARIAITDSAGQRGGLISRLWNTTRIIQLRSQAGVTLAQPTSVAASSDSVYWLRES